MAIWVLVLDGRGYRGSDVVVRGFAGLADDLSDESGVDGGLVGGIH